MWRTEKYVDNSILYVAHTNGVYKCDLMTCVINHTVGYMLYFNVTTHDYCYAFICIVMLTMTLCVREISLVLCVLLPSHLILAQKLQELLPRGNCHICVLLQLGALLAEGLHRVPVRQLNLNQFPGKITAITSWFIHHLRILPL